MIRCAPYKHSDSDCVCWSLTGRSEDRTCPYKHGDSDCVHWLFAGRIDDRTCALQIGHGLGYDSLKGSVDDVSITDTKTALGHSDEAFQ